MQETTVEHEMHMNKTLYSGLHFAEVIKSETDDRAAAFKKLRDDRRVEVAARIVEIVNGRGGKIEDGNQLQLIEDLSPLISAKGMEFLRSEEMVKIIEYEEMKRTMAIPKEVPQNDKPYLEDQFQIITLD